MTLNHGRTLMAIPGPSVIPDRVLAAMHRPAPNIYEGPLIDLTEGLIQDLKKVARTDGDAVIYLGNGHSAWEAAISNTLSRGDDVLIIATGRFADGWAEIARGMGVKVQILDFGTAADADPEHLEQVLRDDREHRLRAVMLVHTDTASSVKNDIPAIRRAMNAAGHPALLMVDCIASFACDEYHMDDWGVDVTVAACQKGLMTPPGMSMLFFNAKAAKARSRADLVTSYWDWEKRVRAEIFAHRWAGTAPTHHLFGLREALDMILYEETLPHVWARHTLFAQAIWAAIEAWGQSGDLRLNISDPAKRSSAVTTVWTGHDDANRLRSWCEDFAGLTLGLGISLTEMDGSPGGNLFRIGHMGHLNVPMIMATLGTIDAGLKALNIPHHDAGLTAATQVISGFESPG